METKIRKMILDSAYYAKHGHMPSALSIVEIMCAYDKIRNNRDWEKQVGRAVIQDKPKKFDEE